jgi:tRNA(fMet)-specific endonuclease VapC
MPFLLDTSIMSNLLRFPSGAAAAGLKRIGEVNAFTSVVVACELRYGVAKRGSRRLAELVEGLFRRIPIAELTQPADDHFANMRVHLERLGTPIGSNDLLIAAHARATASVLVTDNVREFSRIPDLKIENWLRD